MRQLLTIIFFSVVLCGVCRSQDTAADYALVDAVVRKNYEGVKKALDDGANINLATPSGWTPLMWAVKTLDPPMVRLLLLRGANRELKAGDGKTAMDMAKERKNDEIVRLIRTTEDISPKLRALEEYLKEAPKPTPTPSTAANTPAAKNNDPAAIAAMFKALNDWPKDHSMSVVRLINLLRDGVNPNARDVAGRTPLMYAVSLDKEGTIVRLLIKNGADVDIQSRDEGTTALIEAFLQKRPFPALFLLAADANTA